MIRGAKVLVVEDEQLSRDVLVRMLESHGVDVHSVVDGPSALQWLEERSPELPDMILLDVSMPGMSGLDVLSCLRRTHPANQLPVILVTALVDSSDVAAGLEAGANDYVVKPVNLPILLARMRVWLEIKIGVERLVEAERHRVMLESLGGACDQLVGPLDAVIENLEHLCESAPDADGDHRSRLHDSLEWAHRVGEILRRFQKVAGYRTAPYTDGMGSFVTASLESRSD